jgi:two-component system, NarL family, nitrate/nitrite response regulator NarL
MQLVTIVVPLRGPAARPSEGHAPNGRLSSTVALDVFIVAGVRLYREGLAQALTADARFRVVGAAAGHAEGLEAMTQLMPRPAVAVLDIGVGPRLLSAPQLRAALPEVSLVALAIDDTDESVVAWAEAGVAGFVTRDTSLEGLMSTVECVAQGGTQCSPTGHGSAAETARGTRRRPPVRGRPMATSRRASVRL